jgi:hypothetical protein
MKKYYTFMICLLIAASTQAQTFDFSIAYVGVNGNTGNYQMALLATPSSSVTNGNTADMGAGFYIPAGLTIGNFVTGNSGLPASEWTSQTMGTTKPEGDPYFVSRIEAGSMSIFLNGPGPFELVLFDIIADPNPTSGNIIFVENGDPVFNELLFIENYINIDLGAGPVNAYLQNDPSANSVSFDTLSIEGQVLEDASVAVYPNPASDVMHVSTSLEVKELVLFDILGKRVLSLENTKNLKVNHLNAGVYLLKIVTAKGSLTKKVVIK